MTGEESKMTHSCREKVGSFFVSQTKLKSSKAHLGLLLVYTKSLMYVQNNSGLSIEP